MGQRWIQIPIGLALGVRRNRDWLGCDICGQGSRGVQGVVACRSPAEGKPADGNWFARAHIRIREPGTHRTHAQIDDVSPHHTRQGGAAVEGGHIRPVVNFGTRR